MPWRHIGEWRYSFTILDLSISWRWVVSFTPLPLYLRGNRPRYPSDRGLSGTQSRSGRCGEENNLSLPGIEPGSSLYRLSYPDFTVVRSTWNFVVPFTTDVMLMSPCQATKSWRCTHCISKGNEAHHISSAVCLGRCDTLIGAAVGKSESARLKKCVLLGSCSLIRRFDFLLVDKWL
jgi:hypothetical protein